MAKRKRLELPLDTDSPGLETKSAFPPPRVRMPIAEVAGDTAAQAALREVADAMTAAEDEGRVVKRLNLPEIDTHYLSRDRMVIDADEMEVLKASIAARGQQTPIEVLRQPSGRYGLISGLRRVLALRELGHDTVLAFVRRPDNAQAAYVAMIEENEIRAGLSFYERANIAVQAVGAGLYPDPAAAVAALFAHAPKARRSKIRTFVAVRERLGKHLRFPAAIPERLGLALAGAIAGDDRVAVRITDALRKTPPRDPAAERRVLERALKRASDGAGGARPAPDPAEIAPGLTLEGKPGRAVLTGPAVDPAFLDALAGWIRAR